MEDIHGVDVSWLHHSNREHHHRTKAPSSPGLSRDAPPKTSSHGGLPSPPPDQPDETGPTDAVLQRQKNGHRPPSPPIPSVTPSKTVTKRPSILGRASSDKSATPEKLPRRTSWVSNITSKFSAQPSPAPPLNTQQNANATIPTQVKASPIIPNSSEKAEEAAESHSAQTPPKPSFLSSALRRLSSGSATSATTRMHPGGGQCARKVLNVDPNRDRCDMPELSNAKLRRVAFCVDVEIASGPRYQDEDEDDGERKQKAKDKKLKEKGEGEALKHPETVMNDKETDGIIRATNEVVGSPDTPNPEGTVVTQDEKKDPNKKKAKKKRSEAERKERNEKKRRRAEENGSIPIEFTPDDDSSAAPTPPGAATPRMQDRPTTDPLRIYRRCCQLRETPILKRISDQLAAPHSCALQTPGTISCLDLTGSRLQLADVVTLSDWLAVVPVKKLIIDDADLGDEAIRVILAGLLAAKSPDLPKRRHHSPPRDANAKPLANRYQERSGVVEKLSLKNNPRLTKEGWKHLSLFIYMCKSLRALDVSMIPFARARVPHKRTASVKHANPEEDKAAHADLAEILSKAISERLGGAQFEELVMAECALNTADIRKIVDGATFSGLKRLSLAGNDLNAEGIEHICRFIKSGVCDGLDIGGNDLRDHVHQICDALSNDCPLWALCLANCNLTPKTLKPLLPSLAAMPCLKFLDLSNNRELFSSDASALPCLRKYLPSMQVLKRLHLTNVSMSPAQAIGLAEVIPEMPTIAHINILENPQLAALANATDESTQGDACALYASLMCAARAKDTLIAIDMEVPSPESSEVVKALAKQVVAYCLRNMEAWTTEAGGALPMEIAESDKVPDLPEVLLHLVGEDNASSEHRDLLEAAQDNDYIVGGTGVVKALSYCLAEKDSDRRRVSIPVGGAGTPRSIASDIGEQTATARNMSRHLLDSARRIRTRLKPALIREAKGEDEMAYKRLQFLDSTLQGIINRFEEEYPDTRLDSIPPLDDTASQNSSSQSTTHDTSTLAQSAITDATGYDSDSDTGAHDSKPILSRHNSDVSLASRKLAIEEGGIHRLGHRIRRDIYLKSDPVPTESSPNGSQLTGLSTPAHLDFDNMPPHLQALRHKLMGYSGEEILSQIKAEGWDGMLQRIGENAEELKQLERENPADFAAFRQAQMAALENTGRKGATISENAIEG